MSTIDLLNEEYQKKIRLIDAMRSFIVWSKNQSSSSANDVDKYSRLIDRLNVLRKEVEIGNTHLLSDSEAICRQYMRCVDSLLNYKQQMMKSYSDNSRELQNAIDTVERNQNKYNDMRFSYSERYGVQIDSSDDLVKTIASYFASRIQRENDIVDGMVSEAKSIYESSQSIVLKQTDPIRSNDSLPESLLIGQISAGHSSLEILRRIGVAEARLNIKSDLKNNGNIIVNTDFEHISDEQIDEFVISYVLRFISEFPLGSINVHIIDQNTSFLYKRLANCFQAEQSGETTKRTVQIHSSNNELSHFSDVICDDIVKKIDIEHPDLFALHESDKSDAFNLIVLRDGLVDGSGYSQGDLLDTIRSLTKPGETGHKCGLRFLIVDSSSSFAENLTANNSHMIDMIYSNCEYIIKYDGDFYINDSRADVLQVQDNLDSFVQLRAQAIASAINSADKNIVSIEDVSVNHVENELASIMYIPVGVSGSKVVDLPFSCKDEDGTVAGQCIGYMAIGQSGSGKSSFFHSIVLNGCMKYAPSDLQFWLLDFKNGGASSKYSKCGIPHIHMIAENNKIDDALCLFQMILEEMERRSKAFNSNFTDNIVEYNKKAKEENLEYFPRIIIAIDEVQEIFREDNASVIQKQISSISTRMRSAGMHFVMVAQNLSEGKSYMLKDAFLPSATGRICFRVAPDIPRDSGFDSDFVDRKQEIAELKTGEAYVSYGKGTIKKVKMAYASPQDMGEKYFIDIRNRFPNCSNMRPLVIGSKKRLRVTDLCQGTNQSFFDIVKETRAIQGCNSVVIGEDAYRMNPFSVRFSQHDNPSLLFLGSDKNLSSSLCASVVLSLAGQGVKVHLFNGDRTKVQDDSGAFSHPYMYITQKVSENDLLENHRLDQLKDTVSDLYSMYLDRQTQVQAAEFEEPVFDPVYMVVNDLFGIECFVNDEIIESSESIPDTNEGDNDLGFGFKYDVFANDSIRSDNGQFRENIQSVMSTLLKNGYRYGIYLVLAIKGDPYTWRNVRLASDVNNIILFNSTEYTDQLDNSYYLKEMLKNVSNEYSEETMAVWSGKKNISKIRPIIFRLDKDEEQAAIDQLLGV